MAPARRGVTASVMFAAVAGAIVVAVARAQPVPTPRADADRDRGGAWTQSASQPTSRPGGMGRGGRMGGFGPRGDYPGPPTPEEWAEIEVFMQANSPIRLEMLKRIEGELGKERPIAAIVRRRLAQRYRELERMKNQSPDMYQFSLKQLQIEDQVLGTMRDQRAPDADQAKLEQQLDGELRSFLDNYLGERQVRLDRLKQIVERESQNLAKDRASTDELVKAQRDKFQKEMAAMLDFNANGSGEKDGGAATQPVTSPATAP